VKKSVLFALFAAVTSICSGQWLERLVVLGDTFGGIYGFGAVVANPVSGNVYIDSRPIQIFNPETMEKMRGPGVAGSVVFCPPSGKGYVVRETLLTIDALADTVIGRTVLPFRPGLWAYSRTSNRLYLGSNADTELLVFDPDGDSVLKTVPAAPGIKELLWDSVWNRVYFCRWADTTGELEVLDCVTDTLLPGIRTGLVYTTSLALSTGSHKLYYVGLDSSDARVVAVINTDSLALTATVPGLPSFDVSAYSPVTDRLYLADDEDVYSVDCRADTMRALRYVEQGVGVLSVSSLTGNVYLGLYDTALILVMDTTDSVVDSVPLPGKATNEADALTFSPERNELYGATDGALAFAVDAAADTVLGSVSYVTVTPTKMIHNPAGNKLYAFCPDVDSILVFDTTFGTPKRIACSMSDPKPVLNQALDRFYVATGSRVRVIDCNSDSLIANKVLYGISHPLPVLVPYLNKLYVFSGDGRDSVYAYDGLRDQVSSVFYLSDPVTGAAYEPRSNRVFFSCGPSPTVRALDPVTDSVVKTFDLVSTPFHGRMAVNVDLGRLYYTDQLPTRLFTIDVLADSVISVESLPGSVDTMFLNRRLQKLYLCVGSQTLVFDCARDTIVGTIAAGFSYSGLMDERNDKLFLRYGAVVDCRYDSVVTRLDSISPRSMAWDAIDNRVFQATTSRLYVYHDDPYGIQEQKVGKLGPVLTVLGNPARSSLRLRLQIPHGEIGVLTVFDAAGRLVHSSAGLRTSSCDIDVRTLSAGIYFIRLKTGTDDAFAKVVVER
jgi:DNA-binding beta-propeller fold protein YncE